MFNLGCRYKTAVLVTVSKHQTRCHGFTLLEIMIALMIFATIAAISSSVLYQSFRVRDKIFTKSHQLEELQMTYTLMQRDIEQFIPRQVRGNEMHLFPAFIGQTNYLELTRAGAINPMNIEQRSTLKRIAYICEKNKLIQRSWSQLDTPNREDFQDTILVDQLSQCSFSYLNSQLQILSVWYQPIQSMNQFKSNQILIPKAVGINLTHQALGRLTWFFIIPRSLYVD